MISKKYKHLITHLENGTVLYDGTFADMDADGYGELFATSEKTETIAYYKIEVSLPTTATNEYQAAKLLADFEWKVSDAEILDPPQTGDTSIMYAFFFMISSLALLIVLLVGRRNRRRM